MIKPKRNSFFLTKYLKNSLLFFSVFFFLNSFGQVSFYQDICKCGVTAGGFSTGMAFGSGSFDVYIEPGSTIKKAYIFTYKIGYPPPAIFILNGNPYVFDTAQMIMNVDHKSQFAIPVQLFYKDVTSTINPTTLNNSITIPNQFNLPINWGYWTFFLYVVYENSALPMTSHTVLINDQDLYGDAIYSANNLNSIDTSFPVGFSIYTDRVSTGEPNNIIVNSTLLGSTDDTDATNSLWSAGGVKGHFYYQNNQLFGLDDDTPDAIMGGSDGLADISSYLTNNTTSLDFQLTHVNYPNQLPARTSIYLEYFLSYTSPCDTFSVITPNDTTLCEGEALQLNVAGGQSYEWLPATGLSCTTCPNPVFTADSSMFYTVRIWNNDSCSVVRPLKINVRPKLEWGTITTTSSECGESTGTVTLNASLNNGSVVNWQKVGGVTQTSNVFNGLSAGNHTFFFTDTNGCQSADTTILVGSVNSTIANFSVSPQSGAVPLTVAITNTSQNANNYEWFLDGVSQGNSFTSNVFGVSGNYEIMLVAWNNDPLCADTAWQTVNVYDSLIVTVPNVFTPNHDNINEFFTITANQNVSYELLILNRWGNVVFEDKSKVMAGVIKTVWDAGISPDGVYFVKLKVITENGEVVEVEDFVTVVR